MLRKFRNKCNSVYFLLKILYIFYKIFNPISWPKVFPMPYIVHCILWVEVLRNARETYSLMWSHLVYYTIRSIKALAHGPYRNRRWVYKHAEFEGAVERCRRGCFALKSAHPKRGMERECVSATHTVFESARIRGADMPTSLTPMKLPD